jgi:hypothetical protein
VIEAVTHVPADAPRRSAGRGRCVAFIVNPLDHEPQLAEQLQ